MRMSDKGRDLLKEWEGVRSEPYLDSVGLLTIGCGHLLTKHEIHSGKILIHSMLVPYEDGLLDEDIDRLLEQDLAWAEDTVNSGISAELSQSQFDALVSFVFNIGKTAFLSSTLRKVLNQGKFDEVPKQMLRWHNAGGKPSEGLMNRREAEVKLFLS